MLHDELGRTYKKVITLQALLVAISTLSAWLAAGPVAACSAVVGGAAVLAGSLVYVGVARTSKLTAVSAGRVLARHLLAEAAKVLVILATVLGALASGWFAAGWLIAAMAVTLLGHWLALLIIR